MRKKTALLLCLICGSSLIGTVRSQYRNSLWGRRRIGHVNLYRDTQAHRAGDILTIVITENTNITNRDQRQMNKDSKSGSTLGFTSTTTGDLGVAAANANIDHETSAEREFNGNSRFSSARGFTDRVMVRVHSVLPNGNLWVAGTRRIVVEGDERYLYVSGIVRPLDVLANNTVQSQYVANLRLNYVATGTESKFTKQGWLNRKLNRLWPF